MLEPLHEFLRTFAWLEPLVDLARLAVFVTFLVLGLLASRAWKRGVAQRFWTNVFLAWVLIVTFSVGLLQVESWPFSNWALVWGESPQRMVSWSVDAIDARGESWPVDMRIVQPVGLEDFGAWLGRSFPELSEERKSEVGPFILRRAEDARRQIRTGELTVPNQRLLSIFAAPHHFLTRPVWTGPEDVPDAEFVAIRIWILEWSVREREEREHAVERRLLYQWPG